MVWSLTRLGGVRCGVWRSLFGGGTRTASMQEGLDCLGFYHSGLEGERYFRLVVELT